MLPEQRLALIGLRCRRFAFLRLTLAMRRPKCLKHFNFQYGTVSFRYEFKSDLAVSFRLYNRPLGPSVQRLFYVHINPSLPELET